MPLLRQNALPFLRLDLWKFLGLSAKREELLHPVSTAVWFPLPHFIGGLYLQIVLVLGQNVLPEPSQNPPFVSWIGAVSAFMETTQTRVPAVMTSEPQRDLLQTQGGEGAD